MQRRPRLLFFDTETKPFPPAFNSVATVAERQMIAPEMRVACVFDGRRWRDFLPDRAAELVALLESAEEVVSFNGKGFDELVLRRHCGLTGAFPKDGRHSDLLEEIVAKTGCRVSLDALVRLNLGERKHTDGRSMENLDPGRLVEACRSDVRQTRLLWLLWQKGKLSLPGWATRPKAFIEQGCVGPGHHMPTVCPFCHDANSLVMIDMDQDDMSEGEEADYLAGAWGVAVCETCGNEVDWGF